VPVELNMRLFGGSVILLTVKPYLQKKTVTVTVAAKSRNSCRGLFKTQKDLAPFCEYVQRAVQK
jgi:hypothetical protein